MLCTCHAKDGNSCVCFACVGSVQRAWGYQESAICHPHLQWCECAAGRHFHHFIWLGGAGGCLGNYHWTSQSLEHMQHYEIAPQLNYANHLSVSVLHVLWSMFAAQCGTVSLLFVPLTALTSAVADSWICLVTGISCRSFAGGSRPPLQHFSGWQKCFG